MTTSRQYLITQPLMLDHNIIWYIVPERPPARYQQRLSIRRDFWRKQALVLSLVAQGFALESEIKILVAQKVGCSMRSVAYAIQKLDMAGLLHKHTLTLGLGGKIVTGTRGRGEIIYSLVRLNRYGRGLCRWLATHTDKRWRPHETEWERMRRIHEQGKREPEHTLGTLVFAYQARQEGWQAGVMPGFQEGRFVPDALVEKDGKRFYVEIEFHYGKHAKWRNMHDSLGYIALCGRSSQHEQTLLKECMEIGEPVYSTNLTDLIIGERGLLDH